MATWGVTERGFKRKTYSEIISTMEGRAQDLFGPQVDLSSASPLALFMRVVAFAMSLLWMVAERVYGSAYIDTATGQSLDYAVKYAGISRRPPSPARRMARFTGDPGVTIPRGFLIETEDGDVRFATVLAVTIGPGGAIDVLTQAETPGIVGNVAPGQLDTITNPVPGIAEVKNVESESNVDGLNRETDRELRERYYLSLSRGGASTVDSIRASVLEVPGVRAAQVFQNPTMDTDSDGRPPKSVEAVVLGGADEDIAGAVHRTIAAGIEPYGGVQVVVEDAGGQEQIVRFNRAQIVDVYVDVELTPSATYPTGGDDLIRDAIIAYVGGTDGQGQVLSGVGMGADVIWTAVIQAARSVTGVIDVDVTMGTAPDPTGRSNIDVSIREVAETDPGKVVIRHA